MSEQRLEQLEDELAKVEMQLRCVRAELDEIGVSKVPENVKAGTFLDTLVAILCVVGGGIITTIGVSVEGMILKLLIIPLGIAIIGVGISHNVNKVSVPDKMIRYNTLEKRAQELKEEIQTYRDSKAGGFVYSKCRDCSYVCGCCSARINNARCSGCENHYDEFKPAENIKYCPLTGEVLSNESAVDS